ncbi:protein kinase domain-containing protein [Burkholderia ubonensis]|uniref:protein kinase domain-containing protein n=1 Tax=Burkholderia ubonensis TaxID=101571 RepID=UPI0009B4B0B2|nr:protein kinase [Burkholderia ubonensis]
MNLVTHFKQNNVLETDIGDFTFASSVDQGGNAHVLKFTRDKQSFAIKFIPHGDKDKLQRFRDEFFCAAQIPTHINVVRCYHFDSKTINGIDYSIIVMKLYQSSLNKMRSGASQSAEERHRIGRKLFIELCNGLHHLHTHHIIHRDIKPQNILYDADEDAFVIADLGIAHFKDEIFAKEARTKEDQRLGNRYFSAPEQANSKNIITEAADIFALGQVMQWYFTGDTHQGVGRRRFHSNSPLDFSSIIDSFVDKALRHSASERPQTIVEVKNFVDSIRNPKRHTLDKIDEFDDAIRYSFPSIRATVAVNDEQSICNFLNKFKENCTLEEFWYILADGGDNTLTGINHLGERRWLFNEQIEMTVDSLIIYRNNNHPYKNFFILLFGPDKPFSYTNREGETTPRKSTEGWDEDAAVLVDELFYINPDETINGYYREKAGTTRTSPERFKERYRYLIPYGVMVVPTETASAGMLDRHPTSKLIQSAIRHRKLAEEELKDYLEATQPHHSVELTKFN